MRSRPVRLSTSWFKEARSVSEGQYNEKFKTPVDVKKIWAHLWWEHRISCEFVILQHMNSKIGENQYGSLDLKDDEKIPSKVTTPEVNYVK